MDLTDNELIKSYLYGDEEPLRILIARYLKPIYGFVYRYANSPYDTEDITQEIFVKVWKNLKKFDQSKSFKTWIFSVAKNTAIDFLKKKKTVPFSEFETAEGGNFIIDTLEDPGPLPPEILESKDISKILESVIQKLSPKYRAVLFLRYNDHLTFREIADIMEEPLDTVKSRHRRAVFKLKELLLDSKHE